MSRYRLSSLAEGDLSEIWLHVAQDRSAETANRLIDEITERFLLLASHPRAGRPRNDLARNLRSFPVKDFVIYYLPDSDGPWIVRVLHGKRDQANTLSSGR